MPSDPIALEDQRRHRVIGHRRDRDPAEPAAPERHPQELGHVVSLEADGPPALRERQGEGAINPLEARGERVDEAERQRPRLAPHDALDSACDHVEYPAGGPRSIRTR